jgi:hypothetical protein
VPGDDPVSQEEKADEAEEPKAHAGVEAVTASPVRALLAGAIDYAGLFPPASLPMRDAVREYAAYLESPDAWALGRFVVPIARLAELRDAAEGLLAASARSPWRLSAIAGAAGADECNRAEAADGMAVDALEMRVSALREVADAAARLPAGLEVFYEIPIDSDPRELIAAIGRAGGRAKVRTGGVSPDAFPPARDLARFIAACARAAVPFKATAGLHHALRATYRLTYAPDSPTGEMFGFLNVLLAAALAHAGAQEQEVAEMLVERDASAIRFGTGDVEWRGRVLTAGELAAARSTGALSFGSCSFREPIDELKALELL